LDFVRHAFSVHSLKMQADKGIDLYCALPVLSTYLGHKSVKATDGYVRLTEEMYPELIKKTSAASGHIIPRISR
jgi:site-specific recombinase XerD